ncbi:putative bifunctional diguanylate cyclase/phosphodiesterase [Sulfuricystis thermophila]|uniref:putative bifunctional diguanylate cyclase/phosphodiesterase n=1 Tax=Sulfuricystis thermophila TaxID=2496847 RepID=UPI001035D135|nr:bifunctional diguanylate cyclase/phosphodiesterase [Sulfuricystis thermophila]
MLTARDCLCPRHRVVGAMQRYRDVAAKNGNEVLVYAVFEEDGDGNRFLGLVEVREAALFPARVFADLLVRRQPPVLAPDTPVDEVWARLEQERCDYLPIVEADGAFRGVVSRLSLVAALMEQERALNEERERLIGNLRCELENRKIAAAVFDATAEGIMVTDAQGRILLVNAAFCRTTGYAEEEAIGQTPALLKSGRHDAAFYAAMWREIDESGSWEGEIWNRRKSGEIYPEWLHIDVVRDEQGAPRYYVGVFADIGTHKELRAQLMHLAYHDALTGLPNRRLLLDRLGQAIARAQRNDTEVGVLFLDLDRFKDINDTHGHGIGDRILVEAARRLTGLVRANDTVARLGGDEFAVIVEDIEDEASLVDIAEKLLSAFTEPFTVDAREFFLAASVGIARYPGDGDTVETLLMNADTAMYGAKQQGRSCYKFFASDMHLRLARRIEAADVLRKALGSSGLTLAWQPQVRLADGAIAGVEVLLRLARHEGISLPSPAELVAAAEESGLIKLLGQWVLREACELGTRLNGGMRDFGIAVNFSPLQFDHGCAPQVLELIEASGLPPQRLEVEITESALASENEQLIRSLETFASAGIAIAVDDFGTGYSNLGNLLRLHVDKLKIDQAFVGGLEHDEKSRKIVQTIIQMGRSLGMTVVAEGVETETQAQILRDFGCDLAQGYLFARPLAFEDFARLLSGGELTTH